MSHGRNADGTFAVGNSISKLGTRHKATRMAESAHLCSALFMTNLIEARMQVAVLQEALWEKDLEETKRAELEDALKKAKAVSS